MNKDHTKQLLSYIETHFIPKKVVEKEIEKVERKLKHTWDERVGEKVDVWDLGDALEALQDLKDKLV